MKTFELFIATPDGQIFSGQAKQVTIPTSSGVITVLAGHQVLMSSIEVGELVVIDTNDKKLNFAAYMGVVNI